MSDYEHYRGKLIPVHEIKNESLDDYAKRAFEKDFNEDYWNTSRSLEDFIDNKNLEDKYIVYKDIVYKIENKEKIDEEDSFIRMNYDNDGNIVFITRFYNGGTCLQEMLEEGLNTLS